MVEGIQYKEISWFTKSKTHRAITEARAKLPPGETYICLPGHLNTHRKQPLEGLPQTGDPTDSRPWGQRNLAFQHPFVGGSLSQSCLWG